MTVTEVLARWSEACTACELKGDVVRDGNWQPAAYVLRHFTSEGSASVELVAEHGSSAILKITPAKPQSPPPAGKTWNKRPAFLILMK